MKKIVLLIMLLTNIAAMAQRGAPILTVEDVDSLVMEEYKSHEAKIEGMKSRYNSLKTDKQKLKLSEQFAKHQAKSNAELLEIYAKYLNVERVIERLFTNRMTVDKEQLEEIYQTIPERDKLNNPYAKSLKTYIDGYQIAQGDTIGTFGAITSRANPFTYAEFKNEKDILLIFGDMESSGLDMKIMLQVLYRKIDISKLEFVSVFNAAEPKDLTNKAIDSDLDWLIMSDFKGDHSPLSIAFGVYAEPMAFYISKGGCVESISLGLSEDIINRIKENSFE